MALETIEYSGTEYPVRYAHIDGEDIRVSTEALDLALCVIDEDGNWEYKDEDARYVDEGIYCYVEDHILHGMEQDEFNRYIRNNYC